MLGYLSLDINCSSKLTVFLELRSRKTVRFSEQIMSKDIYILAYFRAKCRLLFIYFRAKWRLLFIYFRAKCRLLFIYFRAKWRLLFI